MVDFSSKKMIKNSHVAEPGLSVAFALFHEIWDLGTHNGDCGSWFEISHMSVPMVDGKGKG